MKIKYYGFGKQYIGEEILTKETVLPAVDICGYEIFDEEDELKRACFQGKCIQILELLDKDNSVMNIFPEKIQAQYRDLANKLYKQENFDQFIINVRENDSSFQPVIPCEETVTFRTRDELESIFQETRLQVLEDNQTRKM